MSESSELPPVIGGYVLVRRHDFDACPLAPREVVAADMTSKKAAALLGKRVAFVRASLAADFHYGGQDYFALRPDEIFAVLPDEPAAEVSARGMVEPAARETEAAPQYAW